MCVLTLLHLYSFTVSFVVNNEISYYNSLSIQSKLSISLKVSKNLLKLYFLKVMEFTLKIKVENMLGNVFFGFGWTFWSAHKEPKSMTPDTFSGPKYVKNAL